MDRMLKAKHTYLEMVFPPISNREVAKHRGNAAIQAHLRKSDFYIIAAKAHGQFANLSISEDAIKFDIKIKDAVSGSGEILLKKYSLTENRLRVAASKMAITIWATDEDQNDVRMLDRYTPEGAVWRRSRFDEDIAGLDNYEELSVYDLLYVGIATKGDAYDRVIGGDHHARLKIMSEEPMRTAGAHISDEIFCFFFQLDSMYVAINANFEDESIETALDVNPPKRVLADAEKAFIRLLDPNYNAEKYRKYPKGKNGLYASALNRYQYSILENLIFNTPNGRFRGGRSPATDPRTNLADFLMVDGDEVSIHIAGKDFDSTDL